MPSLFARLATVAGATCDAVYSEGFHVLPMAPPSAAPGEYPDVNARRVPSTARESLPFRGTYVAPGAILHAHGRRMADSSTRGIVTERPMVDAPDTALTRRVREGDRISRDDTGEVFEVAAVLAGDFGRLQLHLSDALPRPQEPR